jgi:transketolase C-terminal domain/subunit
MSDRLQTQEPITKITKKEPKAIRDSYGEALLEVGKKRSDIVVLDADKNIIETTKEALKK